MLSPAYTLAEKLRTGKRTTAISFDKVIKDEGFFFTVGSKGVYATVGFPISRVQINTRER